MKKFSEKFIQRDKKYSTLENHVSSPYLRKSFQIETMSNTAEIAICGLGFYELYLNGKNITKGLLAPYISNPDHVLYYDVYDVKNLLSIGENVIGIVLGNGFINCMGGSVWEFDKAEFRDAPKVALSFILDGETVFETDESFKTHDSPITFDDFRAGERYDARKEIASWCDIGFDDSFWDNAIFAQIPKGEQRLCQCEPIVYGKEYLPKSIKKVDGGYLYCFDFNNAGVPKLTVDGKCGQEISLTCGEVIKDGKLDLKNISFDVSPHRAGCTKDGYNQRDIYICNGKGKESYVPRFTYHGFQYVFVEGITEEQATPNLITYIEVHSDIKTAGEFTCSDDVINSIQEITVRSTLSNFVYFPTDCPHREKNGWTGDAEFCAEETMLNFNAENSYREWLFNIRKAQTEQGAIPGVVPTSGFGYGFGSGPAWDNVLIQLPYYSYKYSGNVDIIKENIPAIIKYIRYMFNKADLDGLIEQGLGDWCQVGKGESFDTNVKITDTLYIMEACYKTKRMLSVLKDNSYDIELDCYYKSLKDAFRTKFIANGKIKDEFATQTAIATAIYYKAFDEDEIETAKSQLIDLINSNGDFMKVGVIGARVLFRVLSELGCSELAYKMITRSEFPSYGYLVEKGATTLWETMDGKQSLNHYFWGDVSAWFYKYLAGIRINPKLLDINRVEIKPVFIKNINSCSAKRETAQGILNVCWERKDKAIELNITAPKNIKIIADYSMTIRCDNLNNYYYTIIKD